MFWLELRLRRVKSEGPIGGPSYSTPGCHSPLVASPVRIIFIPSGRLPCSRWCASCWSNAMHAILSLCISAMLSSRSARPLSCALV